MRLRDEHVEVVDFPAKGSVEKGRNRTVRLDEPDPKAKRLYYIFLGDGRKTEMEEVWRVGEARLCVTERHPDLKCSLSDRFAGEAAF